MITMSQNWEANITASSREIKAKVELFNGSTLAETFLPTDKLVSIKVEKTPANGAFFGYTICQKATITVLDINEDTVITKGNILKIYLGTQNEYVKLCDFYADEITRDEVKKVITITAFDIIQKTSNYLQKELNIALPITLTGYAQTVAAFMGLEAEIDNSIDIQYTVETPPNFEGNESLREVITAIAAATGTICYISNNNKLRFKSLYTIDSSIVIAKKDLFELSQGERKALNKITHVTELGDNVTVGNGNGFNHVIRDNPFIVNRNDISDILTNLYNKSYGLVQYPYKLKWRGNPALEIGDRVYLHDTLIYYLGETITYNGGLIVTSEWNETEEENPEAAPITIGEAINQTTAKVDKVNKQITLFTEITEETTNQVAELQIEAGEIKASVETNREEVSNALDEINNTINKVEASLTDEALSIKIETLVGDGAIDEVTTSTGFTFNSEGLTVSKATSEMTTTITEDGMQVSKDGEAQLTANNTGVIARNLHAETYLIIGVNSRFEDFTNSDGEARTGCFWIGG